MSYLKPENLSQLEIKEDGHAPPFQYDPYSSQESFDNINSQDKVRMLELLLQEKNKEIWELRKEIIVTKENKSKELVEFRFWKPIQIEERSFSVSKPRLNLR